MSKVKSMITTAAKSFASVFCLVSVVLLAPSAQAATVTCERTELKSGESTNLVERFIYTAEPAQLQGGVFKVSAGATLTGTNVTFAANETKEDGGAIFSKGTVSLKDTTFTGNKARYGGGLYNGGVMTLDNIRFSDNLSKDRGEDGAIDNGGILNFDGPVTLVTTNDTVYNSGTLNWNLTNGKVGCLNGYQYLTNDKDFDSVDYGVLKLTVEDYTAMPTNFVIATGDFSNIAEALREKDTFSITNVTSGATATIKINGSGVATGTKPGNTLYRLVTEEDLEAGTTNLVLQIYEITVERFELTGTTNLVEGVYTAAPTRDFGGVFNVSNGGELTGTNVTFEANEADDSLGGAIHSSGGTVSLKDATFKGNKAWSAGALNNMNGLVNLDGVTFDGNKADFGGAITSSGLINLDGPVTLVTASDTIDLIPGDGVQANEWYWDSVLNWNLAGGKAGLLNGYDKLINEAGVLKLTIDDALVVPTNIVIATGDFSDVEGKDTFTIMNVTANGAAAVIKIGGLISLDGTWWSLNVEGTNLVFSSPVTAKLSDVLIIDPETGATNATAVVTVDGKDVEPDEDGNYMIPKGYPVILNYTAKDDYMFPAGLKSKKVVLDSLTGDISMKETGYKPVAEPTWSDTRTVAFDTRERIVVTNVNDVLPIAYSTNNWGEVRAARTEVEYFRDGEFVKQLVNTNENGYVEWQPTRGEYGKYSFFQTWYNSSGGFVFKDNATVYYGADYQFVYDDDKFIFARRHKDDTHGMTEGEDVTSYSLLYLSAYPPYSNVDRYEFATWKVYTYAERDIGWKTAVEAPELLANFSHPKAEYTTFEMPFTNVFISCDYQWKSNYTWTVEVEPGINNAWEIHEGETYQQGITTVAGSIVSLRGKVKPGAVTLAAGATNIWDFTNGGQPCFEDFSTIQNNGGTLQIWVADEMTNGTYRIAGNASDAVDMIFKLTNGAATNDCTVVEEYELEETDWTPVGEKVYKLYVEGSWGDADGGDLYLVVSETVARIGEDVYSSLDDAFDAAEEGDVVVLLKNCKATKSIGDKAVTLDEDGFAATNLMLSAGTELTLKGNRTPVNALRARRPTMFGALENGATVITDRKYVYDATFDAFIAPIERGYWVARTHKSYALRDGYRRAADPTRPLSKMAGVTVYVLPAPGADNDPTSQKTWANQADLFDKLTRGEITIDDVKDMAVATGVTNGDGVVPYETPSMAFSMSEWGPDRNPVGLGVPYHFYFVVFSPDNKYIYFTSAVAGVEASETEEFAGYVTYAFWNEKDPTKSVPTPIDASATVQPVGTAPHTPSWYPLAAKVVAVLSPDEGTSEVTVKASDAAAAIAHVGIRSVDAAIIGDAGYAKYFRLTATPNGDGTYRVKAELDEKAVGLDASLASFVAQLPEIAASAEKDVTVTIGAKPGLCYRVKVATTPDGTYAPGAKSAPASGDTVDIVVTKPDSGTGFYKLEVSAERPAK